MELYKVFATSTLIFGKRLGEFISGCSKRIDYSFGKVHFTSEILD